MFELNGVQYSQEQVEAAAAQSNMSVEDYIERAGLKKTEPTVETTAPAVGRVTRSSVGDSQQVVGSLDSQEAEDEPNILQSLAARTARGFVDVAKGLSSVKDAMIVSAANLFDPDMTSEEREALYATVERGIPGLALPSTDNFEAASDWLTQYVRDDELENQSVTEALKNGDFAEAAELTVGGALESIPSVLAALTGYGGIALFGASVAGNKFDEELEKNPKATTLNLASNALLSGATEAGFELVTRGILKKAGFINGQMGAKAAKEFLNQSAGNIAKKVGLGYLGEAGSEAATELTQTINDAYGLIGTGIGEIEGRADDNLVKTVSNNMNNIIDAGIIGGFMGGTISTVGQLGNQTAVRNRAEEILAPEVQKEEIKRATKNISRLTKDLENTEDEYQRNLLLGEIESETDNLIKTKKDVSLGLSALEGDALSEYAENAAEIEIAKKSLEKETTPDAQGVVQKRIDELVLENEGILENALTEKYEKTLETSKKEAEKLGIEFKEFDTAKDVEDYILSKDKRQTKKSKVLAETNDGFIIQNPDGSQEIVINKEVAQKTSAVNVAAHELLHGVLYKTLKDNPNTAVNLGKALGSEIAKIDIAEVADSNFLKRLELYKNDPAAMQGEEILALFADAVATGDIKYNDNIFTKLGDGIRKILETIGVKKKFNTGRDVYNFIKDYNADIAKGGIRQSIIKGATEGFEGKLVKADTKQADTVIKESKSNLQGLLDKYGNKRSLIQESLLKTPQGQETFDFTKSEFGQEVGGLVEAVTKRLYDPIPADAKKAVTREEYKNAMISDLATIVDQEYDPAKQNLDKFVSQRAFQRSNRLAKQLGIESKIKQDVTEAKGIKAEETAPEIKETKAIAKELNIAEETIQKAKDAVDKAVLNAQNKLKGTEALTNTKRIAIRNKAFNDILDNKLYKDIQKEFGKNTATSKSFTDYLNKNYNTLKNAALKNINFKKGVGKSLDWNQNPPSKQEFIDYYIAEGENASTKSDRKRKLAKAVGQEISEQARQEYVKQNPIEAEQFAKETGIILASKSIIENYSKKNNIEFYDVDTVDGAKQFVKEIGEIIPLFPKGMMVRSMLTRSLPRGISEKVKSELKKLKEFDYGKDAIFSKTEPYRIFGNNGKKIKDYFAKPDSINNLRAYNNKNSLMFDSFWSSINDIMSNPETKKYGATIYYMLEASNKSRNHPHSLGAEIVSYAENISDSEGIVYEHAVPNMYAAEILMNAAGKPNFNNALKNVKKNYKISIFSKADAKKIDDLYQRGMPEGFNINKDSYTDRYNNVKGIDLSKQKWVGEGKNVFNTESTIKSSKSLDQDFNKILEEVKGVKAEARYSEARAAKLGKKNNPFKFFVPYSAEDYMGLIYPTLGKGKIGDKNLEWYKKNIIDPYARGIRDFESAKQESLNTWAELKKQIKNTPAKLNKEAVRDFTNEEAIRIYLWNKQNTLPGTDLAKKDIDAITKHIESKPELLEFANQIQSLTVDGYPEPTGDWLAGTITTDLVNYTNTVSRKQYLQEWQDNIDVVYSKDNMNKLRALYGDNYVEALQDMLHRMKTGRNRPSGGNKLTNQYLNWVNDSVGTIMFFNMRSALLQTISSVNYLNWTDNNPVRVAKAFGNQPQFWKDFSEIFNSDFLKSRRSGLKTDVNADEIARTAETSKNKFRAGLSFLLKKGFLPTQMADSFAISFGGATFYRNRINKYIKEGLSEADAKEKAFLDFKEITEESQQSSRPDRVSMQQASPLGRVILAFANTPMQYTRLTKKAALDLINGRGDWKTNISKLAYYGAVQNIIFTALQSAMFAMLFSDEDDDKEKSRYGRIGNGIADTLLRGAGVAGAAVATAKNMVVKAIEQYKSGRPNYEKVAMELTTLSPPINSKLRKLQSAGRAFTYKQNLEKMREEGPLSIDNPAYMAAAQTLSAVANVPLDRALRKLENLRASVDSDTEMWQRISLMLGYSKWDVGLIDQERKQKNVDAELRRFFERQSKIRSNKPRSSSRSTKRSRVKRSSLNKGLPQGVLGRANNDGTIEVKPGLPEEKKKKVIAHEKQHIKDMKSGKLNYDDNFVYWNSNKYKRTNDDKIIYNGKKFPEGHSKLPWEKVANKAERQVS